MRGFLKGGIERALRVLPQVLLVWGFAIAIFLYGFLVSDRHWFPSAALVQTRELVQFIRRNRLSGYAIPEVRDVSDVSPVDLQKHRVVVKEPVDDGAAFLLTGGNGQYLEYCPEHGCTAVSLARNGSLVRAYPYRPEELTSKRIVDLPYSEFMHDDGRDTGVFGLTPLPNGDLIVVYDFTGTTPYGGGIGRIDKDGRHRWYRRDYSNHWPKVTPQNQILVLSHKIGPTRLPIADPKAGHLATLTCPDGMMTDVVRVLDLDGQVKEEIPIFDSVLASPYASVFLIRQDPIRPFGDTCDPLHSNSVVLVGQELAERLNGVEPDDLLVSFRNISALAIFGRSDHRLKRLFRGSFIYQHSAQPVPGGKIVLFNNVGSSPGASPSRVLLYDPVNGEEHTILPNKHIPKDTNFYSLVYGNIDVSDDGTRALVTVSTAGKAYEIQLADGRILTTFDNLHDVSSLPQFARSPKPVRYFTQFGVYYVSSQIADSLK